MSAFFCFCKVFFGGAKSGRRIFFKTCQYTLWYVKGITTLHSMLQGQLHALQANNMADHGRWENPTHGKLQKGVNCATACRVYSYNSLCRVRCNLWEYSFYESIIWTEFQKGINYVTACRVYSWPCNPLYAGSGVTCLDTHFINQLSEQKPIKITQLSNVT